MSENRGTVSRELAGSERVGSGRVVVVVVVVPPGSNLNERRHRPALSTVPEGGERSAGLTDVHAVRCDRCGVSRSPGGARRRRRRLLPGG